MLLCANAALEENKQKINELNVFPVPDGDTGTNMSLTMNSAAIELGRKQTDTVGAVADCAASALLRGARGNSGVILSLLFRGVAKSLKGRETASAAEFAAAVSAGVDAAYKAVMKPAEGTILTVSRLGAQAAVAFAKDSTDFEGMLDALLVAAREALADTQNINPVLRRAGVVDAGGEGFVLVMDAMLGYLQGRTAAPVTSAAPAAAQAPKEGADFSEFDTGEITFGYCTEFIVARENSKSPELLRSFLKNLGDCVVVVDDDEIIKVHVHTNVPGEVLTEALTYGPLQTVKIENMRNQHTALSGKETEAEAAAKAEAEPEVAQPEKQFGVVAVSAGEGMANLFRELGVDRVVTGGQTMNPSTEDILTEVNKTPAEVVFVLPNNKNIIMAAQQCIPLSDKKVIVIPTKTVPQGITAMLSFDPASAEDVIEAEMSAAIESVHTAQITYAARDSDFDGHNIRKGEYLALMDGALLGSDADLDKVLTKIADAANDLDPEIVSIYYGEDVQGDAAQHVADLLGELLLDPLTRNGRFLSDYVESEKENLIDAIESILNDKRDYADARLLQEMCRGERYGIDRLGTVTGVERLTNQTLYRYYNELLATARIELFYCGSADCARVEGALDRALAALPRERVAEPAVAERVGAPETVREITETMDVTQAKLAMGYRAASEDTPALLLANLIFGGYSNSKLFLNVREKLSLCYYASSGYHRSKGIITVSSGIEAQNYEVARREIAAQLEAVQNGDFEPWELEGARSCMLSSLRSREDSAGRLEEYYLGQAATGLWEDTDALIAQLEAVTPERVAEAARSIRLDTVYFLTGKEGAAQ